MPVTRGLIIADPWVSHILDGRKDWEMRSQATAMRGWFGLIRKGSGQVAGLARLVECGQALSQSEMIGSIDHHRIPEEMIRRGEVAKWVVPWKLADIIPFEQPITYQHKSGAVTWVTFSAEEIRQLNQYLEGSILPNEAVISAPNRMLSQTTTLSASPNIAESSQNIPRSATIPSPSLPEENHRILGRSRLTGGNVRNNHINLSKLMDAFEQDVIGGKNKADAAPRQIQIDWGGPEYVLTDIDGSKSIFRARGWVRQFFTASGAQEGDVVILIKTAPYKIYVRLEHDAQ